MGYKCGNCNIEFGNKDQLIVHMATVHDSYFEEGDELWIRKSDALKINEDVQKVNALVQSLKAVK